MNFPFFGSKKDRRDPKSTNEDGMMRRKTDEGSRNAQVKRIAASETLRVQRDLLYEILIDLKKEGGS